jgi:hypothetical protein
MTTANPTSKADPANPGQQPGTQESWHPCASDQTRLPAHNDGEFRGRCITEGEDWFLVEEVGDGAVCWRGLRFWDRWEAGESQRSISRAVGRSPSTIHTLLVSSGWRRPLPAFEWSPFRLSLTEREEISRGFDAGSR